MAQSHRWNLFVRTLEDILTGHHWQLNDLEREIGVHHEKLRRLKQSLETPKSFPTLNPDELGRLRRALSLTLEEEQHLKAALLATAIEEMLMDRIPQDQALRIAEQIQPIIEEMFRVEALSVQSVEGHTRMVQSEMEEVLAPLLALYDHGILCWHLSEQALGYAEQLACLHQAEAAFSACLQGLQQEAPQWKQNAIWQMWLIEAQTALTQVQRQLQRLEG